MKAIEKALSKTPLKDIWQKIGIRHHHGFLFPLLGIHSKQSVGCGEYLDLLAMVDYAKKCDFDIIQILPVNDTGAVSSPYSALSSTALHPIYLSLRKLPFLDTHSILEKDLSNAPAIDPEKRVDYLAVYQFKMGFLKKYFQSVKQSLLIQDDYLDFCKSNSWLLPYALYRALKDDNDQRPWVEWPENLHALSHTDLKKIAKDHQEQIEFYSALQYLCFKQLKQVRDYADRQNIKLMGDIPILINTDSVDCWHTPHFFNFDLVAGAPPDIFNKDGQCWNFPLYNWPAISQSDYAFWKTRLHYASHFYHIYRIDHVIGCFRIWAMEKGQLPTTGHFIPSDPGLVLTQGLDVLTHMIAASDMLPIAEDLGIMPDGADKILENLGIPGTRIIGYVREDKGHGPYIPLEDYDPVNLTSLSSHDLLPIKGWWQTYPSDAKDFCDMLGWTYTPEFTSETQKKFIKLSHQTPTLFHINLLNEYLACTGDLTSTDPEDERINRPGTILSSNWTYRYKLSVEDLARANFSEFKTS